MDLRLEEAALLKSLYGTTAGKVYWDPVKKMPRVQIVDTPENLYLGYGTSDYTRVDWALYSYGLSPQAAMEDYGINVIPVRDGEQWFPYTSASTHDDPIASIYLNSYHRDPVRYQTAYDQMKIEVMDYWYKHPTTPGKPPLVCNVIIVGNTIVKKTEHPSVFHPEYENAPDKNPGELSCQERSEIEGGTQLLATNMAVAAFILGRVQKTIVQDQSPEETEIYFDLGIGKSEPYNRMVSHVSQPVNV